MRKRVLDLIENIRAYGGCVFASLVSSTGDVELRIPSFRVSVRGAVVVV